MKNVLLLISLSFISIGLFAQKYSNEFLSIGVGAQAQGLGNAVVAGVHDVTAGIWNPAGLASIAPDRGLQLGAMHAEWFAGVGKFDYLGFSLPLADRSRRIGISVVRFGIDQIPNTLSLYEDDGTINFDNLKEFSAADYAFFLSYAQPIKVNKGKLLIGGNVKVVHRQIGPFATSWGFGIDLGAQYLLGKWRFGAVAKDLTTTFNAWSFNFTDEEKQVLQLTNNEVPIESIETTNPSLILGASYQFQIKKIGLRPELNLTVTTDGQRNVLLSANPFSLEASFGLEADYNQFVFLRAGVTQFQRIREFDDQETLTARPSIGVGLVISALRVDYAYTKLGVEDSFFSHIISLTLDLKPRKKN